MNTLAVLACPFGHALRHVAAVARVQRSAPSSRAAVSPTWRGDGQGRRAQSARVPADLYSARHEGGL